jgi:hypothetical protein
MVISTGSVEEKPNWSKSTEAEYHLPSISPLRVHTVLEAPPCTTDAVKVPIVSPYMWNANESVAPLRKYTPLLLSLATSPGCLGSDVSMYRKFCP